MFGLFKLWSLLQEKVYGPAKVTVLSAIAFDSDDETYIWIIEWIMKHSPTDRKLTSKAEVSPKVNERNESTKETLREPPDIL